MTDFASPTADQLRARGSLKWSTYSADVLPLWVAEMDFPTCPVVVDAVETSVASRNLGYAASSTGLKEAFARFFAERTGLAINPEWVEAVPDVLRGIEAGIDALSTPGSPVVVTTPAYMPFLDLPSAVMNRPTVVVPQLASQGWALDLEGIDRAFADGAGALILCQPHNPTGRVFTTEELQALARIVDRHGGMVVSDEIHAPLTRSGASTVPYASVSDIAASHCVTVTAATKAFSIPGLICAVATVHTEESRRAWRKHVHPLRLHGTSPLGVAASTAAFSHGGPWLDECRQYLDGRAEQVAATLAERLPEVSWSIPRGTYFAWLDFSALPLPKDPGVWLRRRARVALNSGPTFGRGGERHARLNFATTEAILAEALERIVVACQQARDHD